MCLEQLQLLQILSFSVPSFSLAKDGERGSFSKVCERYREAIRAWKDLETDFYLNDSPNDNLKSNFKEDCIRDALIY